MPSYNKTGSITLMVIFAIAIFSIGNWIERHQTFTLLSAFFSAAVCYILILQQDKSRLSFTIGFLARLLLFFSLPTLSDDLYRFIWDGTLLTQGMHPFEQLPGYYLDEDVPGITLELYERLNSPNYFTIYPPLNQGIFWLSALIGNGDLLLSANVIRIVLLGADIGAYFLLRSILEHTGKQVSLAHWYWLNPLVILEGIGNVHFEGMVVCFLLLGIYAFHKGNRLVSAAGFGLSIGTKLLPLIYLPVLFLTGSKNRKWTISIFAGIIAVITFLPMLNAAFLSGMTSSLDLYFQSFEFNASLYFIVREVGFWIYGYNQIAFIGPFLSICAFLSILLVSYLGFRREWDVSKSFLFILSIYLIFATTVHPWYILPLVALGILSGFWYPIVWSLLIFLTYVGYTVNGFELPAFIVVIEYSLVVLTFLIEIRNRRLSVKSYE